MPVSHCPEALGGHHCALDLFGTAEVEQHHLAEDVDAVFVAVELVVLVGGEAVGPEAFVEGGFELFGDGVGDFFRGCAHEGDGGEEVGEVAVVGEATAEFAVGDLAIVDVPVDEALEVVHVLDLEPGPGGHSGGDGGLGVGRRDGAASAVGGEPVFAAEIVVGVDFEEVGDVAVEAVPGVEALGADGFFDHIGEVVFDVCEAVGDVFGNGVLAGLEDEADLGPFECGGTEVGGRGGDGDVEAFVVLEDAVASVEPERVWFSGLDGEAEVEHVPHWPERVLDLDVHGDVVAVGGLQVERG